MCATKKYNSPVKHIFLSYHVFVTKTVLLPRIPYSFCDYL